ncbi:tripartite-type tricarboxylate transporter receptor subunit TctC [Variovorax sp. TBS-050B]|uniref:Bug family tripartite tricarboxylate transporter substrate binding protein n=1 Tax=Variovorax sp. TBS-050B TaxID=2940551 RepID=UPI0024769D19|nr:tripartite tricarboxylate transporter substrate binding protein [Variovorax sp. TBS-050B]MDH6592333.1 tripartite-type tricarboxylate transporter receptor subunit TctC [Variovorax sp. TBS-050B]
MTFLLTRRAAAIALLAAAPLLAQAADYPAKPIRFIVPYTPGGTTDLVARTVGQKVSEKLGQPVLIDNRGGAGGNIGMDAVAKAAPDGYTIGFGAISTNALNPHIYRSMAFDPRKDFTAISLLGTSTIVLEVPAGSPIRSVADLIAAAKKAPGLPYATAGAGTSMNLAGVMFAQMTGTELTHVAYKGSGPAITDMLGNNIGVMFDNLPASLPHIQAGKLRALAVAGPARSPALPEVPTMAEAGLKGYALEPWFGVYGPANLPAPVVKALNEAFVEALAQPEVKAKLAQAGFSPRGSSAQELATLTQNEYQRLGEVAKKAGMTAE